MAGRRPKVTQQEVLDVICGREDAAQMMLNLPVYSSEYYKDISKSLHFKWSAQNVYTNLREDRLGGLRTAAFARLGLTMPVTNNSQNEFNNVVVESEDEDISVKSETSDVNISDLSRNDDSFSQNEKLFNITIPHRLYDQMKPTTRVYKGRERLVLEPGIWSDIVADEFSFQTSVRCAYTFKNALVSREPVSVFIKIIGKCKSKKCNAEFLGIAKREPREGEDLRLTVRALDTSRSSHEIIKRQLRNYKRKVLGETVVIEGAANCQRQLASELMRFGVAPPPNVYNLPVLRKLRQETRDKQLGLTPEDGKNPILTLQKLKYTPPYIGSIHSIGLDDFFVHIFTPEMLQLTKEYSRFFGLDAEFSMDSTGGLVDELPVHPGILSGHIFGTEIIIRIDKGIVASVGLLLSVSQDTSTYEFFLKKWLKAGACKPSRTVGDYSRALQAGMCQAFNGRSLKEYVDNCFIAIRSNKRYRPAHTFIRIDVSHFMAIVCRSKCFNKENTAVKNFLVRSVALLVSCDNFEQFEEILMSLMTITSHKYEGEMSDEVTARPAKVARIKLQQYIATEQHAIMRIVPEEESAEFDKIRLKMASNGEDPMKADYVLNKKITSSDNITKWLADLERDVEIGNTAGELANAYYLPGFYKQLMNLAKEFPMWSAVMTPYFECKVIRATSAPSEGHFNELKNRILCHYLGKLRLHKFFIEYWRAIQGTAMLASGQLTHMRLQQVDRKKIQNDEMKLCVGNGDISKFPSSPEEDESVDCSGTNPENFFKQQETISSDEDLDIYAYDNWRNKAKRDDPLLISDSPPKNACKRKRTPFFSISPDLQLIEDDVVPAGKGNQMEMQDDTPSVKNETKRTKYFKPYPEIQFFQNNLAPGKRNQNVKLFLRNGSKLGVHRIHGKNVIVLNTCPFDAILLVQSTAAIDSKLYRTYLEENSATNETFSFILKFIVAGGVSKTYIDRAILLMDKYIQKKEHKVNDTLFQSTSPGQLRTVDSFTYLDDMWGHLMKGVSSICRTEVCEAGHETATSASKLYVAEGIIRKKGFAALAESIVLTPNATHLECKAIDCACRIVKVTATLNIQLYIDLEVINIQNEHQSFLMCKPTDIPAYISLQNQSYRLAGIVTYEDNHFVSLCRRVSGNWEVYNDILKKKSKCKLNETVAPKAAIFIRLEGEYI